ncbi:MAG: phosphopentomutase [Verrucomicrobiales bacterium]
MYDSSPRIVFLILDSFGIGGAPDAGAYGDEGADTLGHIAEWFREKEGRGLVLPNLGSLGLAEAHALSGSGVALTEMDCSRARPGWRGHFAAATELSNGKDTPSGHWELLGLPVDWNWAYYPDEIPCFPPDLLAEIYERAGLEGSLGNKHASGTEVIAEFGAESVRTGKPIFYTSADSVFQIAAHEKAFGLGRLYELCDLVRELTLEAKLGRVIARPFVGEEGTYERTGNRRDYAMTPPRELVLNQVEALGGAVYGVGKIGDIFAHSGVTHELKASGHEALWERTREALGQAGTGDVVLTNFVDFDMLFGHRRDPRGYGLALEEWDRQFGLFLTELRKGDLLIVTADHGNDPTWRGTDHTRERVPVLIQEVGVPGKVRSAGVRESFADVGATVAEWLGFEARCGQSLLRLSLD